MSHPPTLIPVKPTVAASPAVSAASHGASTAGAHFRRRDLLSLSLAGAGVIAAGAVTAAPSRAATDDEYVKETEEVIGKVRAAIGMDRADPGVAGAVAELREASNSWVAKYRREKALLGRVSFRDIYSALNAVSGHYVSFGPTTPIPSKRKVRILEEIETGEKALLRGR